VKSDLRQTKPRRWQTVRRSAAPERLQAEEARSIGGGNSWGPAKGVRPETLVRDAEVRSYARVDESTAGE